MATVSTPTSGVQKTGFPPQIKYIIGNEAAERFSYYGMRAILVVFMVKYMAMEENHSASVYHDFITACYLLPFLGAFLSDKLIGKYKTIIYLSIVYCVGHGVLAIWEGTTGGLYWGLGLIALGAGGIKPCVSAHVGDQFDERNNHLLPRIFEVFYFSINLGATAASLLIPWILPNYGPGVAFGIPGGLMVLATIVFWMGRKYYVHVPPSRTTGDVGFLPIVSEAMRNQARRKRGESYLDAARGRFTESQVEGAKAFVGIMKLFIWVSVFWALFDQTGSSWVLQAEKMDLQFMGWKLESSQMQAWNPLMVMGLIPLFSLLIYPAFSRSGIRVTPLRKMSVGMLLAASSFIVTGIFQMMIDQGTQLNVMWQFAPYLLITISEIMVSITGLEFAYTQAPRALKSTVMSFWLFTVAVGNQLTSVVNKINLFEVASTPYFFFFAAVMGGVALLFVWSATRYKERDFVEKAGSFGPDGMPLSAGAPTPVAT